MSENPAFLKDQLITYIGNKRSLLPFIGDAITAIKADLGKEKISFADVFSGSGIVARLAKSHSNFIYANDLELYSKIINECYLSNANDELIEQIDLYFDKLASIDSLKSGFIAQMYAPRTRFITKNDRAFYTKRNAKFIDTMRLAINKVPKELQRYFIAPLLSEASIHSNTCGVFKGFYKNKNGIGQFGGNGKHALSRITGDIILQKPILSDFNCEFEVSQKDAMDFARQMDTVDIAYLDPPYNQHPYGSNYFMLNLIASYKKPQEFSKVSAIPKDWNRSIYNKKSSAKEAFFTLLETLKARYLLISFNDEGFISKDEFLLNLQKIGKVELKEYKYNAFRGSRNLNSRSSYVTEWLYIIKKHHIA